MSSEPPGGAPDVLQPDEIRQAASLLSDAGFSHGASPWIATGPNTASTAQQITAVAD